MSGLLPVWGNTLVASAYLSARANSTLNWYRREKPLTIPSRWHRLIPFAYSPPLYSALCAVSSVSEGGACPTGVKGQGGLCTSASIPLKATILD
jgi:hypothetical protein